MAPKSFQVVVPAVCFVICIAFQMWEIAGSHDRPDKCRGLFKAIRAGWVKVRRLFFPMLYIGFLFSSR